MNDDRTENKFFFAGEMDPSIAILLAVLAAALAWWLYRLETRKATPAPLDKILPLLRAAAVALLVLTLAGPTCSKVTEEGKRGQVLVFLDGSLSMSINDKHMSVGRKLLIAQRHGWLPPEDKTLLDSTLNDGADLLEVAYLGLVNGLADDAANLGELHQAFTQKVEEAAKLLQGAGEEIAVAQAAKNLQKGTGDAAETTYREGLGSLTRQASSEEKVLRVKFDRYAEEQAASNNEAIRSALAEFDKQDRWNRATHLLSKQGGILRELADTHVMEVRSLEGSEAKLLWSNAMGMEPPQNFSFEMSSRTDLVSGVQIPGNTEDMKGKRPKTAIVILSDGRHNDYSAPISPLENADQLKKDSVSVHTIGFGDPKPPPDLAVISVNAPLKIKQGDRFGGSITIKDNLPKGTPFEIVVMDEDLGEVLWRKSIDGGEGQRGIKFDFPVDEELVKKKKEALGLSEDTELNVVTFRMKIGVEPIEGEAEKGNNQRSFAFDALAKINSVLVIDGRPRWESRYVKNLFDRDPDWTANAVYPKPGADGALDLPRGEKGDVFPSDKETLFAYDLLVLGEINLSAFTLEEQEWMHDFVVYRGGGIILLDGPRQKFRIYAEQDLENEEEEEEEEEEEREENPILSLLPVKWPEDALPRLSPQGLRLTKLGENTPSLFLDSDPERNLELWGYVPKPGWVSPAEALPASDVYLQAVVKKGEGEEEDETVDLLVGRKVGSGQVLYAGFDSTWRWREEASDKYHQRYWQQIALWIMEEPFVMSDEFVSIDREQSTYRPGEKATIRVRVKDSDGKPLIDKEKKVEAVITRDGKEVANVILQSDGKSGGLFLGETPVLESGEHEMSVRVPELYKNNELKNHVKFYVEEPAVPDELTKLNCNESLLREIAERSDGSYLKEEQMGLLNELLKPISSGRVVKSEIALWQSYWWFTPIVLLLGLELFLRKRAGML